MCQDFIMGVGNIIKVLILPLLYLRRARASSHKACQVLRTLRPLKIPNHGNTQSYIPSLSITFMSYKNNNVVSICLIEHHTIILFFFPNQTRPLQHCMEDFFYLVKLQVSLLLRPPSNTEEGYNCVHSVLQDIGFELIFLGRPSGAVVSTAASRLSSIPDHNLPPSFPFHFLSFPPLSRLTCSHKKMLYLSFFLHIHLSVPFSDFPVH